jgi:hypothetical protein
MLLRARSEWDSREGFLDRYRRAFEENNRIDLVGTLGHELEIVLVRTDREALHGFHYSTQVGELIRRLENQRADILKALTQEFFAGQLEIRTGVHRSPKQLSTEVAHRFDAVQSSVCVLLGPRYELRVIEYLPDDGPSVPQAVTPIPRYKEYAADYPRRAARMLRVAAGQFHVGCRSFEQYFDVAARWHEAYLSGAFDGWFDERRRAAFIQGDAAACICPGWDDRPPRNEGELWECAVSRGFADLPSFDWGFIRPHPSYGTAEFRLPGPTIDTEVIEHRAQTLLKLGGFK